MNGKSVFLGDQHSAEFWFHNYSALRAFQPDYLLLEVIGKHRFMNKTERDKGKNSSMYLSNNTWDGYNSDAFLLADDLDIPMIGIDVWEDLYIFPTEWAIYDSVTNCEYSHRIRERNMVRVVNEFLPLGKVLLIVGAEHLRDDSELSILARRRNVDIKFFEL